MKTLRTAIKNARKAGHPLHRALNGLVGCPVGVWGETEQALRAVTEELPRRECRTYTLNDLTTAVLEHDHADRYQWKVRS